MDEHNTNLAILYIQRYMERRKDDLQCQQATRSFFVAESPSIEKAENDIMNMQQILSALRAIKQ